MDNSPLSARDRPGVPRAVDERWQLTPLFLDAARHASFADAARERRIAPSSVTRAVARLEEILGLPLFVRGRPPLRLTAAGAEFRAHALRAMAAMDAADDALRVHHGEVRGLVRLQLPNAYGRMRIAPLLGPFLEMHPEIDLELAFSDRYAALEREPWHLTIRVGDLPASRLVARRIASVHRALYAAPAYLARYGAPTQPADLAGHATLGFSASREAVGQAWLLRRGRTRPVRTDLNCRVRADDVEVLRDMVVSGLGIAQLGDFLVQPCVVAGTLLRVLPDWEAAPLPVHAVWHGDEKPPARVRALLQWLAGKV